MKKLLLLALGLGLTSTLVSPRRATQAESVALIERIHPLKQDRNIEGLEDLKQEAFSKNATRAAQLTELAIREVKTQEATLVRSAGKRPSPVAKPTLAPATAPRDTRPVSAKTGPPPIPKGALPAGPPPLPEGALTRPHAPPPAPPAPPYPVSGPPAPPTATKPRRSSAGAPKVSPRTDITAPVSPGGRDMLLKSIRSGVQLKKTVADKPKSRRAKSDFRRALEDRFRQARPQEEEEEEDKNDDEDWQ